MKKLLPSFPYLVTAVAAIFSLTIPVFAPVVVNAQSNPAMSGYAYCFTTNLGEGRPISSSDAAALSTILRGQGFWTSSADITAYTDAVASAVVGFQEKYASQILTPNGLSYGTGYVGASTRTELNVLSNCSSAPTASTTQPGPLTPTMPTMPTMPITPITPPMPATPTVPLAPPIPIMPTMPTSSVHCPAGYTCIPIIQNPVQTCPMGYVCTPITTMPLQTPQSGQGNETVTAINHSQNPDTAQGLIYVYWPTLGPGYTYTVSASPSYTGSVETTTYLDGGGHNGVNMGCWGYNNDVCYRGGGPFPTNGPYTFTVTATSPMGNTVTIGTSNAEMVGTSYSSSTSPTQSQFIPSQSNINTFAVGSTTSGTVPSISLDAYSPQAQTLAVNNPTSGQYLRLPVLVFDINSRGAAENLAELTVQISQEGQQGGAVPVAYLYQGSSYLATASVNSNGTATFDITSGTNGAGIPANSTVSYTVKVDVVGLTSIGSSEVVQAGVSSSQVTLQSNGSPVSVTGSVQGYPVTVSGL